MIAFNKLSNINISNKASNSSRCRFNNTLFPLPRALNTMDTIASQGGRIDIGGYQWPPTFFQPAQNIFGNFGNLLFLGVCNFRSHFEALNDVFWENGEKHEVPSMFLMPKVLFLG
jgi:hypothetical protein